MYVLSNIFVVCVFAYMSVLPVVFFFSLPLWVVCIGISNNKYLIYTGYCFSFFFSFYSFFLSWICRKYILWRSVCIYLRLCVCVCVCVCVCDVWFCLCMCVWSLFVWRFFEGLVVSLPWLFVDRRTHPRKRSMPLNSSRYFSISCL